MKKWLKYTIFISSMAILVTLSAFIYLKKHYSKFPYTKFFWIIGIAFGIIGLVWLIVWFIIWKFFKGERRDSPDLPKQPVDTDVVWDIWKQVFIVKNKIPFRIDHSSDEERVIPLNENAIECRNETSFTDPQGGTADEFWAFEAWVSEGTRIGSILGILRIDRGEAWIRKNWNFWLKDRTTLNSFKSTMLRKYPLTSSINAQERLMLKKMEMITEEGYSPREVRDLFEPFITSAARQPQPVVQPLSIKAPELKEYYPEVVSQAESEDNIDAESVQDDIDEYRRKLQ